MNNERRKAIRELLIELDNFDAIKSDLQERITALQEEETEYYDNMPESFQNGDKGAIAQAAADNLEYAADAFDQFDLGDVRGYLESAAE